MHIVVMTFETLRKLKMYLSNMCIYFPELTLFSNALNCFFKCFCKEVCFIL